MSEIAREWEEQLDEAPPSLTRNDRFGSILVLVITALALTLGLLLRQSTSNQTWTYTSRQAGIEALYPAGWLVDERGDYVVRIRDPKARPFKTQFVVTIVPAGGATSVRNVLDSLTLQRSADLSAYRVLSIKEINAGIILTEMNFAYVEADPNPYIQRIPVVVLGRDIVILDGDRAIVITYMADQSSFEDNLQVFQRFLVSLRY